MPSTTATINPDLQKERNAATFNPEEFTLLWYGGEEKLQSKKALGKFLAIKAR